MADQAREQMAKSAREASFELAAASDQDKCGALMAIKQAISDRRKEFQAACEQDAEIARKAIAEGKMLPSLLERLDLNDTFLDEVLASIDDVVALPDPAGKCTLARQMGNDLNLYRVTSPIGVLLVIFESRPDAAIQILSLAVKSGNACILKGGKEAAHSMKMLNTIVQDALRAYKKVPALTVQFAESRSDIQALLGMDDYVDLVVPRGSNELVKFIKDNTRIPVLGHADGICMTYVDKDANVDMALNICEDAKLQYVAACNTLETLLVHKEIAATFLPKLSERLMKEKVEYRADENSINYLPKEFSKPAAPEDFRTEFLAKIMAVKVVSDVETAIKHINMNSSHHTDGIVTENKKTADKFMKGVDSSGVYCNCSTRFADGFRYGFGAEVGISTNKIHARGPVGLEGLVTYRFRLYGKGQLVGQFHDVPEAQRLKYLQSDVPAVIKDIEDIAEYEEKMFSA